jgi:hypothetical protein
MQSLSGIKAPWEFTGEDLPLPPIPDVPVPVAPIPVPADQGQLQVAQQHVPGKSTTQLTRKNNKKTEKTLVR